MADDLDAPIAEEETESWTEFGEISAAQLKAEKAQADYINENFVKVTKIDDGMSTSLSGSLQDLVNSFDETINKCFQDFEQKTEVIAPVQTPTEDEILKSSQVWYTITGNFGNMAPLDWSSMYIRQAHTKCLNLRSPEEIEPIDLDLPDDLELKEAFDHHTLVTSCLPDDDEPIQLADEVISELDEIMGESTCTESDDADMLTAAQAELLSFRQDHPTRNERWIEASVSDLQNLSVNALNEYLEDLDNTIRELSEILVHELACRDEQEFEKEQKEQFVSLILGIHKKKRELQKRLMKTSQSSSTETTGGGNNNCNPASATDPQYLSTVIPYHNSSSMNVEHLQIFNKIMRAVFENNSQVNSFLTDYILNVYAPAEKTAPQLAI